MKKSVFFAATAIAMMSMVACSGNNGKNSCDGNGSCGTCNNPCKDQVYTGVLPAADAAGVRYTLTLDYDDDHNYTDGDYDLIETYLVTDSVSATGYKDGQSFKSEGDFTVIKGSGENQGKTYLKLVQDVKDSAKGSNSGPMYFLVESDSTVVMVNSQLEQSVNPDLNYTLKLVK